MYLKRTKLGAGDVATIQHWVYVKPVALILMGGDMVLSQDFQEQEQNWNWFRKWIKEHKGWLAVWQQDMGGMKSEMWSVPAAGGTTREDDASTGDRTYRGSINQGKFWHANWYWKENITGSLYSSGCEMWQRNMELPVFYVWLPNL